MTFPVEVTPKLSRVELSLLSFRPHLALCFLTCLCTNTLLLPREHLPPASLSLCTHLYCAKGKNVEIQPELPLRHISPVLFLLAGLTGQVQHPTGTKWLFLAQEACPVVCWLVPPCSWSPQCSSLCLLQLSGRSPWKMHLEGSLDLFLYSCTEDKFAGSLHVPEPSRPTPRASAAGRGTRCPDSFPPPLRGRCPRGMGEA